MFSDLLSGKRPPPEQWRSTKIIVLFKKGDVSLPKNYRPIAIIPVLCKLFSGVVLLRIKQVLDPQRIPEEMGFRETYGCSDLVHTLRMVGEKGMEWGESLWMASLDLEKAFDKVLHSALYQNLHAAGISDDDLQAIKTLYADQSAYIQLDPSLRSRCFPILRGVRQGDPMSPILFACALRGCMQKLKLKWDRQNYGAVVGASEDGKDRLCFVSFADDTTLIAKSKRALRAMLRDIHEALQTVGLNLNADKCKIQCSKPAQGFDCGFFSLSNRTPRHRLQDSGHNLHIEWEQRCRI
jgi:hypothetical protein